tara:strand:+ start:284 stop:1495 length:1212 start_codon:yes stop_codon:yes gene_type:complete
MISKYLEKKFILSFGLILGLISIYYFGDRTLDNEWKIMVYNLEEYNILSSRTINGELIPNIFMPPLYPLFLFSIKKIILGQNIYIPTILCIQLFLYLLSGAILEKTLDLLIDKNFAKIGMTMFILFPLNIYSVGQISSINLNLFLMLIFIYSFVQMYKNNYLIYILSFSISASLLMLLRGEFFIFFLISLFYLLLKKKSFSHVLSAFLISLVVLSPYLIRNFKDFGLITITKSTGFNLLKGNNPLSKVEGVPMWDGYDVVPDLKVKLDNIKPYKKYDVISDKIFLERAIEFISEDPKRYMKLYLKKTLSFLFIDVESSYPGYYSFLNIIPKLLLSVTSLISIIIFFNFKINLYNYFVLYYFSNIGLFSFFFILPRYTLSILPIQIILSVFLIKKINKKLNLKL